LEAVSKKKTSGEYFREIDFQTPYGILTAVNYLILGMPYPNPMMLTLETTIFPSQTFI